MIFQMVMTDSFVFGSSPFSIFTASESFLRPVINNQEEPKAESKRGSKAEDKQKAKKKVREEAKVPQRKPVKIIASENNYTFNPYMECLEYAETPKEVRRVARKRQIGKNFFLNPFS